MPYPPYSPYMCSCFSPEKLIFLIDKVKPKHFWSKDIVTLHKRWETANNAERRIYFKPMMVRFSMIVLKRLNTLSQLASHAFVKDMTDGAT